VITTFIKLLLCGFLGSGFSSATLELVHHAGSVNDFLIASVERVTIRADFNVDFLFCRANSKGRPASAGYRGLFKVFWVGIYFHDETIITDYLEKARPREGVWIETERLVSLWCSSPSRS
jgi:hypothetical protein